ncbi:uncharacterized protein B0J16DRAFT_331692 [Fusarium flagelliforme]|uniref:uncharacterized protein n=1 Tax=Fusarium flagelliforme TaxID=2675880 RepID=UPI001E8E5217|nr:uncharacterized protein B0J16DRAFT_331692 [Fusarium flagelliforme]KAH7191732.1 hypothetical protein B0J16DRAFT_331692 [Fusarium flagelliforme]
MAEVIPVGALSSVTYHLIHLVIGSRQASNQVRRSLSLVRTCDEDLQYLITLRDRYLGILERMPIELHRLNCIIEDAHNGLLEVGRIVERCRPEAHKGKIPLFRRGVWALFDLDDFNSQVPIMICHHQSVLTEIQYLRSFAPHPSTSEQGQEIDTKVDLQ